MGINKSGSTNPTMGIRGGHVVVTSEGLILDDGIRTQELEHPPALIQSTELVPIAPQAPLQELYEETIPARIKEWIVCGEGIVTIGVVGCVGLAAATAVAFAVWTVTLVLTAVSWFTANVAVVGTAVVSVLALIMLLPMLFRGNNGTITVKGCAKSGFAGPVTIRR